MGIKNLSLAMIVFLIVLAGLWKLAVGYGFFPSSDFPSTSGRKLQAVFLTNNQVYFGHLSGYNRGYAILRNVYYIQVSSQALQPQVPGEQPQLNLIKLGGELHGPEDEMFIPKGEILFWENLKPDSQVVRAIEATRK